MGAKYLPTVKDQKAIQSFRKKQNPNLPGFKKASAPAPQKGKKG